MRTFISLVFLFLLFFVEKAFSGEQNQYNIGINRLRYPDYRKAYTCFLNACNESRNKGDKQLEIACLLELGKISLLHSKHDSALHFLQTGVALVKKYDSSNLGLLGNFELMLGRVIKDQSDIETAGDHFREAIRLSETAFGKNHIRTALAYSDYAGYFSFKMAYDSGMFWSNKAIEILRKSGIHQPEQACPILIQHGTATKEFYGKSQGLHERYFSEVRGLYREAIQRARSYFKGPSFEEGKALQNLANSYTDCIRPYFLMNNPEAEKVWLIADSLYKEAIRVRITALGERNISVATTRYTQSLIYWYHPSLSRNIESLEKLNIAFQVLDSSFHPENGLSCPSPHGTPFPYLTAALLTTRSFILDSLYCRTKEIKYIFALNLNNTVRLALWDRILSTFNSKDIGQVIKIWNYLTFEQAVKSSYELLNQTKNPAYADDIFKIAERGKNNEYTRLLIKQGLYKPGVDKVTPFSISPDSLQHKLDGKTAFVEYVQAPIREFDNNYVIIITKRKRIIIELEKKNITDSLQQSMVKAMESGEVRQYEDNATGLFKLILKPVLDSAGEGINRLIICPSGSFSELPFEALTMRNTGKADFRDLDYVIHHLTVNYVLNAGITFARKSSAENKGLTVFVPGCDTLPELLFSKLQVEKMRQRFKGNFLEDHQAVLEGFADRCRNESIVHITTHSIASRDRESDGLLLLDDGVMELGDLYGKNIPVDLFVISACQTGSGRQEYGEGTKSFTRSFIYAGARGTISTLWCVDDKATAALLGEFYNQLSEDEKVVDALALAKRKYLSECVLPELANPFYWGGVVFTGEPGLRVNLEDNKSPLWIYLITGIFLLILVFRGYKSYRR